MPSKASAFGSGMGLGAVVIAKTGKASEARYTDHFIHIKRLGFY
jgi:hypothetical protein